MYFSLKVCNNFNDIYPSFSNFRNSRIEWKQGPKLNFGHIFGPVLSMTLKYFVVPSFCLYYFWIVFNAVRFECPLTWLGNFPALLPNQYARHYSSEWILSNCLHLTRLWCIFYDFNFYLTKEPVIWSRSSHFITMYVCRDNWVDNVAAKWFGGNLEFKYKVEIVTLNVLILEKLGGGRYNKPLYWSVAYWYLRLK